MRQRELGDDAEARRQLGGRRLEELEPRGRVVEQVAHLDARARIARHREALHDRAALSRQTQPLRRRARPAREREARDGADGRQGLTPESERRDRIEVLVGCELRGGVPLERQRQLVRGHPDAVVGHADQRRTAVAQIDGHRPRTRVQRVLDQLLHRGGRTFDDFTRGDLVHKVVGQSSDHWSGGREAGSGRGWPDVGACRLCWSGGLEDGSDRGWPKVGACRLRSCWDSAGWCRSC